LHIVYMGERKHENPDHVTASHHDMLTSLLGRSFNDDGYSPVPSRWRGVCQVGDAFGANNCSRKLIGARYYTAGVDESNLSVDYLSPRDYNGHGTFTASVAAGSVVRDASFHGLAVGDARGGAPRARLAVYKAVWGSGRGSGAGNTATVLAAIDDAIHDGVDVLSLSLVLLEEDSFGSLHAVANGITVVYAAGNQGPIPQSLFNTAPWVITVAASTIDRSFPTLITLGNNQSLVVCKSKPTSPSPLHSSFTALPTLPQIKIYNEQLAVPIIILHYTTDRNPSFYLQGQSMFYNSTGEAENKYMPLVLGGR
ncbi:hypothetical protein BHE74_00038194, partial [Ensete ventricosum]